MTAAADRCCQYGVYAPRRFCNVAPAATRQGVVSNRNHSDIVACEPCRDARRPVRVLVMSRRDPIPALEQQLGAELARLLIGWNADDVAS